MCAFANSARARFSTAAKPAQLHLERVRLDDEGEYRCRVDFKRGRTVNTIIALRVLVPPSELYIAERHSAGRRLSGLAGPYDEGAELVLVCVALGGKPRPEVSWRRDFNVIDDTFGQLDKDGEFYNNNQAALLASFPTTTTTTASLNLIKTTATSNELRIGSLSRAHLLSSFTCQANNTGAGQALKSSITLDLNRKCRQLKPNHPSCCHECG